MQPVLPPARWRRRLILLASLSLVLLLGWATLQRIEPKALQPIDALVAQALPAGQEPPDPATRELRLAYATTPVLERQAIGAAVDTMRIGLFVTDNYSIDMAVPMYASEGMLWASWSPALQAKFEAAGMDTNHLLTFINGVEGWDSRVNAVGSAPVRLDNGDYYQLYIFSTKFAINHLGLRHFPFQRMHLPIQVEINDESNLFQFETLRLIPDRHDSGIGPAIDINGFITRAWSIAEFRHQYATDFGLRESFSGVHKHDSYSQVLFDVAYARSVKASIWSLFQPLMVVMAIVILSPSLSSRLWDVRIALPATAVLTLVFLQGTYKGMLPQLPYLTFIDRIYSLAYAICLACFALYVWAANRLSQSPADASAEQRAAIERQINRVDRRFQVLCLLALSVGSLVCWLL